MPNRRIKFAEGEYYHLYNRGALRQTLFYSPNKYHMYLALVQHYASEFGITIISICLMPNHFHILIRVERDGNVSEFMKRVCLVYSKRVNMDLRRTGTIFQGRYQAKHINSQSYLRQICIYIHANPVKASLVDGPGEWDYSNFLECVGKRDLIKCDTSVVRGLYPSSLEYENAVMAYSIQARVSDKQLVADLASMRLV